VGKTETGTGSLSPVNEDFSSLASIASKILRSAGSLSPSLTLKVKINIISYSIAEKGAPDYVSNDYISNRYNGPGTVSLSLARSGHQ